MLIGPSKFIMYYYYCITPILYPYQVVIIITLLLLFINEASEEDIAVTLSYLGRKNNHRVWEAVTAADGNRFTPGRLRFPGEISKWDPCKVGGRLWKPVLFALSPPADNPLRCRWNLQWTGG